MASKLQKKVGALKLWHISIHLGIVKGTQNMMIQWHEFSKGGGTMKPVSKYKEQWRGTVTLRCLQMKSGIGLYVHSATKDY
jgi:hypothetical protein